MVPDHNELFQQMANEDKRYRREAFAFTFEAFNFTMEQRRVEGFQGHIDGRELCEGIREYAEKCFGFLTKTVFSQWGITRTDDFGEIVFSMIRKGLMKKQESDLIDDFRDAYKFDEVFEQSFISD